MILKLLFSLDGLNKELSPWDSKYYMAEFRSLCVKERMNELKWPEREYVIQIARFDPPKGIPNVIDSYVRLRQKLEAEGKLEKEPPQLLVCGHGAVDDPDATIIYDQVLNLIHSPQYSKYSSDMIAMRIPPSDQRESFWALVEFTLTQVF